LAINSIEAFGSYTNFSLRRAFVSFECRVELALRYSLRASLNPEHLSLVALFR
jgi:hypothetical protein